MTAYYNENDPKKAEWLRENIKAGLIADGDVDERSIADVSPDDLAGYTQCHFFAGIGIWSYALRLAGWPDDEPVWTGSCPCQPFSAAGQRKGTEDERHLFPVWFRLIAARRPVAVFGEQVSDGDGLAWLDAVHACMDPEGYTLGVVDTCAAGVGAPHRRQRLYFVAVSSGSRCEGNGLQPLYRGWDRRGQDVCSSGSGATGGMAHDTITGRREERADCGRRTTGNRAQGLPAGSGAGSDSGILGHAEGAAGSLLLQQRGPRQTSVESGGAGPTNGFWRDAEWIWCRDGRWRATEPGTFPLAHGSAARILRLRGYGDGIVAPQAAAFVKAYLAS